MSAIYWGYQGQWGPVDPTVLYRFSDSSAKRAFRLSRHDRKAESAHWVPFSVFFGTNLLLRALLLAESTNWNRSTGLSEGYDTGGTLMVRNPVGNQGKSAKSGNQKSSCCNPRCACAPGLISWNHGTGNQLKSRGNLEIRKSVGNHGLLEISYVITVRVGPLGFILSF